MKKIISSLSILILIITMISFSACKKDTKEEAIPNYSFSGTLVNSTDRPVKSATIQLTKSGETAVSYSSTTNALGEFSFASVEAGTYTVTINATGYNELSVSVSIAGDKTQNATILGSANIYGTIINSQTGYGLADATVSFTTDQNATTGDNAELQTTTDASGNFQILNAPTGNFICIVEADGFFVNTRNFTFSSGENNFDPQTVVEKPVAGTLRIVLNWGEAPADLDAHLTGPFGTDRFHVYFSMKSHNEEAFLDVDDQHSFGPETVTINTFYTGMYRYSVHNYSDQTGTGGSGIAQSPTTVDVYDHTGKIKSYTAPAPSGSVNTWRVFEIDAATSGLTIRDVNTYVLAANYYDKTSFKSTSKNMGIPYTYNDF